MIICVLLLLRFPFKRIQVSEKGTAIFSFTFSYFKTGRTEVENVSFILASVEISFFSYDSSADVSRSCLGPERKAMTFFFCFFLFQNRAEKSTECQAYSFFCCGFLLNLLRSWKLNLRFFFLILSFRSRACRSRECQLYSFLYCGLFLLSRLPFKSIQVLISKQAKEKYSMASFLFLLLLFLSSTTSLQT